MRKKRILFVNTSLTSGGSERVMILLANEFAKRQYEVTMVLVREILPDTYELDSRVECVRFRYGTKNKLLAAVRKLRMLRALMKKGKYDAVISFMYDINVATLMAAWGLRIPVIVSERADPSSRKSGRLYRWLEHRLYLTAERLVLQTEQVKDMFPSQIKKKAVVIPNPIDAHLPDRYEGERRKQIIAAGRLSGQKNFALLIRAFARFHEEFPDYMLTICGIGPLAESLQELAESEGVKEYVQFPGFVSNVAQMMRSASMYVSTSNYEGISNSMLEALAMGVPCVCTDCPVGGASLMIQDGVNGILVPVGDETAVYQAMAKIAGDEKLAEQISRNAEKVRENYSIERITDRWETIIGRL